MRQDPFPRREGKALLPPRDRPSPAGLKGPGRRSARTEESGLMPRKEARRRIERGLYRCGAVYWACATPPGQRRAQWLKIGAVGILEARRRRDEFAYKLASGGLPTVRKRMTVREVADDWFNHLDDLVAAGQLRPRTVSSYKD